MRLVDDGEATALETLDQPDLPQRLGPVEALRRDAADQPAQLLVGARLGQRGVPDVVGDREVGVVDPERAAGLQRRMYDALAVARHEMQPARDVVGELLDRRGWSVENRQAADVHVRVGAVLGVQEAGVDRAQPVEMFLRHAAE